MQRIEAPNTLVRTERYSSGGTWRSASRYSTTTTKRWRSWWKTLTFTRSRSETSRSTLHSMQSSPKARSSPGQSSRWFCDVSCVDDVLVISSPKARSSPCPSWMWFGDVSYVDDVFWGVYNSCRHKDVKIQLLGNDADTSYPVLLWKFWEF